MYCKYCGTKLNDGSKKCPNCKKENSTFKEKTKKVIETKGKTSSFTDKDIKGNKLIALLSYLGILALIPYFCGSKSEFVKYHSVQGMNLLAVWVGYSIVDSLFDEIWITFPLSIVALFLTIISIIGIVNVLQEKAKELPIISRVKIFK